MVLNSRPWGHERREECGGRDMGRTHSFNYLYSGLSVFTYKHRLFTQSTFQWSNVPSTTAAQHTHARKLVKHTKATICTITDINKLIVNLTDAPPEIWKRQTAVRLIQAIETMQASKRTQHLKPQTLWKESPWLHARPVYGSVLHVCMSSNSFCMSMLQWRITRYH